MADFACDRCVERGKTWSGGDPVCGFTSSGEFRPDNWNCATLNALRELTADPREGGGIGVHLWHEDTNVAVLPMPERSDGRWGGFMLVGWYKSRGRTAEVYVWEAASARLGAEGPRPATFEDVERLLAGV